MDRLIRQLVIAWARQDRAAVLILSARIATARAAR